MGRLGRATCTVHLISANTSHEGITCIKAKEQLKFYCLIYILCKKEKKFTRFDVHYMPNPFQEVINDWVASGGKVWQLIEPVDSLHPTQVTQKMIAKSIWSFLEGNMPHVLGPINDRNDQIEELFGGQGGH